MTKDTTRHGAPVEDPTYRETRLRIARWSRWRLDAMLEACQRRPDDRVNRAQTRAVLDELAEREAHAVRLARASAHIAGLF